MPQYPPIQIVDEDDNPIKGANLFDAYDNGLIHRIVMIIIKDTDGRMLLQKRGPNVTTHPNTWDVSAAGAVDEGEDYMTAALRELQEEVGITGIDLEFVDKIYAEEDVDKLKGLRRFIGIFQGLVEPDTPLTLAPDEVTGTRWMDVDAVRKLATEHPSDIAHGLETCLKYL